jgi:hypothetical protein
MGNFSYIPRMFINHYVYGGIRKVMRKVYRLLGF